MKAEHGWRKGDDIVHSIMLQLILTVGYIAFLELRFIYETENNSFQNVTLTLQMFFTPGNINSSCYMDSLIYSVKVIHFFPFHDFIRFPPSVYWIGESLAPTEIGECRFYVY
jgi:hypothetical protein